MSDTEKFGSFITNMNQIYAAFEERGRTGLAGGFVTDPELSEGRKAWAVVLKWPWWFASKLSDFSFLIRSEIGSYWYETHGIHTALAERPFSEDASEKEMRIAAGEIEEWLKEKGEAARSLLAVRFEKVLMSRNSIVVKGLPLKEIYFSFGEQLSRTAGLRHLKQNQCSHIMLARIRTEAAENEKGEPLVEIANELIKKKNAALPEAIWIPPIEPTAIEVWTFGLDPAQDVSPFKARVVHSFMI